MKHKMMIYVSILLFSSACATSGKYTERLDSWVGHPEADLITSWGVPSQTFQLKDATFYVYQSNSSSAYSFVSGRSISTQMIDHSCQTTFQIQNHLITAFRWQGNACKSR